MVQKVVITLVDDLGDGEASETVAFALDGNTYEIDLSEANAAALRTALAGYIKAGRKVGARRGRKPASMNAAAANAAAAGQPVKAGGKKRRATIDEIESKKVSA